MIIPCHESQEIEVINIFYINFIPSICRLGFTMFACCFLDIMYLVLLLFNDDLLILSHWLILDSSLYISDVMFLLLSSLNESIVLESVVSSAYIMK